MIPITRLFGSAIVSFISYVSCGYWSPRSAYNFVYQGQGSGQGNGSLVLKRIFQQAFEDEFPDDTDAFSYVTLTDLKDIAAILGIGKGNTFADLACGRGGPGMWIARATGANVVGIDISEVGVALAKKRIGLFGLEGRADFRVGTFCDTGFPSNSLDGAVSIDALWLVSDKSPVFSEVARILKPGARFVFTSWDGNMPFASKDHRKLLTDAGFAVETYRETTGWRERQKAVYRIVNASREELIREIGKDAALPLINEARTYPLFINRSTRVLVSGIKKKSE
jgi:ubiquinone/menaquinone biosynthesis C-methylase UbiE